MRPARLGSRLALSSIVVAGLWTASRASGAEPNCVTAQCHESLLQGKSVHPATESCDNCHEAITTPHPQPGKATFKLSQPAPELCYQCHDDVENTVEKAAVQHPALDEGCTSCHSPHASNQEKLLLESQQTLCTNCHSDLLRKNMTTLHQPVADGSCTTCHQQHGSQRARLLAKDFPASYYAPFSEGAYALCFDCHDSAMVTAATTKTETGFRDGDRNLHAVHVGRAEKGRTCRMCHELHGGTNEVMIAESVPFGKWKLPLRFVKTATGGACAPACHSPFSYDRVTPGKKPEPAKSK